MDIKQKKMAPQKERTVYVKSINVDELPDEVLGQTDGITELYAVYSADGERLALVKERELAFVLARQNDMSPVTVH
jgi:hypothetical protein